MPDVRTMLARPAPEVAGHLLGWRLTHWTTDGIVTVVLSEVEAYDGPADPASHAWRGLTPRNQVMFGPPGLLYVYFSYGMHWCANVVCGPDGDASAVLLRAGRVVQGRALVRVRRGPTVPERGLARGPACLTQALGIGREHDGADVAAGGALHLEPGPVRPEQVAVGPRVGVSRAVDVPWRFWLTGDETVSAFRRSPRVPAAAAGARLPPAGSPTTPRRPASGPHPPG